MRSHAVRTAALAAAISTAALIGWASIARAEFGPIELVSKSAKEQANEAFNPAISADGRYEAFAGMAGGRRGIFRKDLQTGALAPVLQFGSGEESSRIRPSISAEGRFVAFTTKQQLDPADDPVAGTNDVYVADLDSSPPTYELASAADGSSVALSGGSSAAGRVALSEAGNRIAFINQGQVYVRELGTTRTILITTTIGGTGDDPVPGGGADGESEGAAISADGSTVAWVGRHLPEQVPMLAAEAEAIRKLEAGASTEPEDSEYHEPLWRRVPTALDPDPSIRRVVGGETPPRLERDLNERIGQEGFGWGTHVPRLSADGGTVVFVATVDEDPDLFMVNMAPGLSRLQAVRRLTQWVNPVPGSRNTEAVLAEPKFAPVLAAIEDCAISPDGNRIAFTTARQVFPLTPPTLVSPAPPGPSQVAELYQVDLRGDTIERVTPGGGGTVSLAPGGAGEGTKAPSYSDGGRLLAFASTAYNLVAGDTNGTSDAFVVESPPPAPIEPTKISPRPPALVVQPLWRMTVSTSSLPDGRIRIVVGVPGSGVVRVKATAKLGSRRRRRQVASAHRFATTAGPQKLILHLPRKLIDLARRKGGLYSQLEIGFVGPGGKPLSAGLDARFLMHRGKGRR